jgi:Zn-dependent protease with chaperone function
MLQCVLAHELGHLKCNHGIWLTTANLLALGAIQLLPMISASIQESFLR